MNISKQIKKHRTQLSLSQEELSEKLLVSRQTISNWENERSYPDIHNLLLLSVLFDISLDELVKGDVSMMKEQIAHTKMNHYAKIMLTFSILTAFSVGPSLFLPKPWVFLIPFSLWSIGMYHALKVEQIKKKQDIKTYQEILAFTENKDVEAARKQRNRKKDLLSKFLIVLAFSSLAAIIVLISTIPFILYHR